MPLSDPTAQALAHALDGQFRLEREIGRGGMGVVYLATDLRLERPVAIKTLPPHLAADPAVRARFLREARTAAGLSHPSIVPVYHAGERDAAVYFAMGFVDGESLAERIAREGPQDPASLVPVLDALADALGYAHAHGVVHRDVKAENVILDGRTGRPMVTDFGIARVTEAQPMTATGTVLGTVHYMSPEQVTGEPLDGRADLYALGVLAYYALVGRFPFERASAPAVLVAHVNSAAPRLHEARPELPGALDEIIARLLAKRPDDRFASGEALREALRHAGRERLPGPATDGAGAPATTPAALGAVPMMVISEPAGRVAIVSPPGAAPVADAATTTAAYSMSADEAQQVWARAAELQAHTGVMAPPAAFIASKAAPTTVFDRALVMSSAAEAGIDTPYVEKALAEFFQGPPGRVMGRGGSVAGLVKPGEAMARKAGFFAGARTRIEFEAEIEGELDDEGFEEIAEEVRRALGEMVSISAVGRTLTVTTAASGGGRRSATPRYLQVHVTSRGGRTRVHAFENLSQTAGATFGAIMGVGAGGGGALTTGITMSATQAPMLALAVWASTAVVAYGTARFAFSRTSRQREGELRAVVERVVRTARERVRK